MRLYVPLTSRDLVGVHGAQELAPAPLVAYTVTPGLRDWCATDDQEELEYAALGRAARAALRLIAALPEADRAGVRRVVAAADVPEGAVEAQVPEPLDPEGLGEVRLTGPVSLSRVAALHVDAPEAAADVAAAGAAQSAADGGDERAAETVETAADHELLWFATQELDQLL